MISTFTAFIDSNVFFGARLRSLMLYLAQTKQFRARWSEDVHHEWMDAVVRQRPDLNQGDLARTREMMDAAVLDCLVQGYEAVLPSLNLPDSDDRHILAAAIVGKASVIVTFNEKDFPEAALAPYGIHTRHPDEFLIDVAELDMGQFIDAVFNDIAHYKTPPIAIDRYIEDLTRAGVPKAAKLIGELRILLPESE